MPDLDLTATEALVGMASQIESIELLALDERAARYATLYESLSVALEGSNASAREH